MRRLVLVTSVHISVVPVAVRSHRLLLSSNSQLTNCQHCITLHSTIAARTTRNPFSHKPSIIIQDNPGKANSHIRSQLRRTQSGSIRVKHRGVANPIKKPKGKPNNGRSSLFRVPPKRPDDFPTALNRKRERLPRRRLHVREERRPSADFRGLLSVGER
jgi:hypothetical protein